MLLTLLLCGRTCYSKAEQTLRPYYNIREGLTAYTVLTQALQRHRLQLHAVPFEQRFWTMVNQRLSASKCIVCNKQFKNATYLRLHESIHHLQPRLASSSQTLLFSQDLCGFIPCRAADKREAPTDLKMAVCREFVARWVKGIGLGDEQPFCRELVVGEVAYHSERLWFWTAAVGGLVLNVAVLRLWLVSKIKAKRKYR